MNAVFRSFVIAGLDPAIYPSSKDGCAVNPAYYGILILGRAILKFIQRFVGGSNGRQPRQMGMERDWLFSMENCSE
jgi:hypothetical protein